MNERKVTIKEFNNMWEQGIQEQYQAAQLVAELYGKYQIEGDNVKIASSLISKFLKIQDSRSVQDRRDNIGWQIGMWLLEGIAHYGNENQVKFVKNASKEGTWVKHASGTGDNLTLAFHTLIERRLASRQELKQYLDRVWN